MRMMGSHLLDAAETARVAAGGALAVDRDVFSTAVTEMVEKELGHYRSPRGSDRAGRKRSGAGGFRPADRGCAGGADCRADRQPPAELFDAVAPIVSAESLDMEKIFAASRYGRSEADYLNCPFNKLEYETFYNELLNAERAPLHDFDGS